MARVLCRGKTEEGGHYRWRGADDYQRAEFTRLPSGHVAYIHRGTLFALPLDPDRLAATGPPAPVIENVTANPFRGEAQFAFSKSGSLVYLAVRGSNNGVPLLWFDRQGRTETLRSTPALFTVHRIAPDGQRIALDLFDGTHEDVRIYDFSRDAMSRVTFDPAFDSDPVWTPDGGAADYFFRRFGDSASSGSVTPGIHRSPATRSSIARLFASLNSGLFFRTIWSSSARGIRETACGLMAGAELSGASTGTPSGPSGSG